MTAGNTLLSFPWFHGGQSKGVVYPVSFPVVLMIIAGGSGLEQGMF